MLKIVFLDAASIGEDISLSPIEANGELVCYPYTQKDRVEERVADCDVLITNKVVIGQKEIDSAKNLKLICVAATGTNNVDIEYANQKGIPVKNVSMYSTESVAQVAMGMILNLSCHILYYDEFVKSGRYSKGNLVSDVSRVWGELSNLKLGIVGLGAIGSRVAELASAFGMSVFYTSTNGTPHSDKYQHLPLEELLATCDFISVHAPLNNKTKNLITFSQIAHCKRSAYLLNLGRGGIINEEDLVKALNENLIAGAGIDVYSNEPIGEDSPYFKVEDKSKIILLPHIGWTSTQARKELVKRIGENIKDYIAGN